MSQVIKNPFRSCENLAEITVAEDNTCLESVGGALLSRTDSCIVAYPCAKADSSYAIPEGITAIGDMAFYSCYKLKSISLPASLSQIGENPFYTCSNLTEITVPENSAFLETVDGALLSKPDSRLVAYPSGRTDYSYTVPEGVTVIGDKAFFGCWSLNFISLPEGVTSIGNQAFDYCLDLVSINLPQSLSEIGYYAFSRCSDVTAIVVSGSYAEKYCKENDIKYTTD